MDLQQLIDGLSNPDAYPEPAPIVTVVQTHISVVFLTPEFVYKLKKPVNFGFLDFSTLELRKKFCEEEIRLNRRLAPETYEGVVAVTRSTSGLHWEGKGEPVEWGVKMRRLPDDARLADQLRLQTVSDRDIEELGQLLAEFHRRAQGGQSAEHYGRFQVVAANARENFQQSIRHIGKTISQRVFNRLRALTEAELSRQQALIDSRAERGVTRETHGDLHLNHVYFFPQERGAKRWVIIDCIEFNERFRFADPVADVSFLLMDLRYQGHDGEAETLWRAYARESGDLEGRLLTPLYQSYRAAVRGKVSGFELLEPEVSEEKEKLALPYARGHWLLAYRTLAPREEQPMLLGIGGLPGTGKSTLARELSLQGFSVIRSDVVRKQLAGLAPFQPAPKDALATLYSSEMTDRTYAECLLQAESLLFEGRRVIIDANFRTEDQRQALFDACRRWALPPALVWCQAPPEVVKERLQKRAGDASDANWAIYLQAAQEVDPFSSRSTSALIHCDMTQSLPLVVKQVIAALEGKA